MKGVIMTGSLQIKNDKFYAVLNLKDPKTNQRRPKWISTGYSVKGNKRKAEIKLREIIDEYEEKEATVQDQVLFIDFALKWLEGRKNKIDDVTLEGYESAFQQHIQPYFEPLCLNLSEITVDLLEQYYQEKSESGRLDGRPGGLSKRTIRIHHIILGLIFKEAVRKRLLTMNPCIIAELPAASDKSFKGKFLSESQYKHLLELFEGTLMHDLVQITLIYGLRRSELMGLKWDAIDLEQNTLAIRHTVVTQKTVHEKDTTKNSSSNRIYPILPVVHEILVRVKKIQGSYRKIFGNAYQNTGYVFTHPDGSMFHPSYPSCQLQKMLKEHPELPHFRFHDLRHTCASILFNHGWSMKDVSEWLGHSTIAITMDTYTHIDAHRKAILAKGIEELFTI